MAPDPYVAVERIRAEVPDVITLDIEMPRMDGLTFLEKIMSQHPIPVVDLLDPGRGGFGRSPGGSRKGRCRDHHQAAAGHARVLRRIAREDLRHREIGGARPAPTAPTSAAHESQPKLTADAVLPNPPPRRMIQTTEKVVAVGASTGGTEALREFLEAMPADAPGIVIVQHMPEKFTARFAERLDQMCRITVKEAADGDSVIRGQALIAPGNRHLLLKRSGARYYVEIRDGPLVSRHRPSVDVLFRSAARYGGRNVVGVIMTGMGDDGAKGMLEMKQAGAFNIAQDEASCVVFGMPAEAVKLGAVDRVLGLGQIAPEIVRLCR